jgi:hypothetical protein
MLERLDSTVPLVLLPVRLETRFVRENDQITALRVRIYPDDIHIDRHDPALSTAEFHAADEFWQATWRADSHASSEPEKAHAARVAAWSALARKVGPTRAPYIASATMPAADHRPTLPISDDEPLRIAPKLRAAERRDGRWRKGAVAAGLPRECQILVYQGDDVVATARSAPVQPNLAVAPDPTTIRKPAGDSRNQAAAGSARRSPRRGSVEFASPLGALPVNERLQWLFDYEQAQAAGMAVTVNLGAGANFDRTRVPLITRVIVFGVDPGTPLESAKALQQLLEHHRFSTGAGFVAQGTPTNNTESQAAVDVTTAYYDVREPAAEPNSPYENRAVVGGALGLPDATFARFSGQAGVEQLDARSMQIALWPATLGYWLDTLLKGEFAADDWPGDLTTLLRDHFIDHVRGRGPLPALRIGRQPYGILPTTHWLDEPEPRMRPQRRKLVRRSNRERTRLGANADVVYLGLPALRRSITSGTDVSSGLLKFLRAMWPFWLSGVSGVPHVGRKGTEDVLAALGMNATSSSVYARSVDGVLACRSGPVFDSVPGGSSCAHIEALSKSVAAAVGVTYRGGALALSVNHERSYPFNMPPVLAVGKPEEQLESLRSFLRNRFAVLMTVAIDGVPQSLLAKLVHLSATIASANAAVGRQNPNRPELMTDAPLGGLLDSAIASAAAADAARAPARMEMLRAIVANPTGGESVSVAQLVSDDVLRARGVEKAQRHDVLWGRARDRFADIAPAWSEEVVEIDAALEHLATLPAEALELLLREHLDVCSHRLDAWVTSLATMRLASMRRNRPIGVHLGAYGWVENLHPESSESSGAGYVHAPSLQHATTAALLKAGHVAHGAGTGDRPFAIDLSGERTRAAVMTLEAMSEGQTLGAVLGYRLERRLYDAMDADNAILSQYVPDLRRMAPIAPPSPLDPPDEADEAIAANNVVDGVRLLEMRKLGGDWSAVTENIPSLANGHVALLTDALDKLAADADAVADVLLAESIHQFCLGNLDRSSAATLALSGQAAPPASLDVLKTPRGGRSVTHRLVIGTDTDRTPSGWAKTSRAIAEPRLNAWAGRIFGNPLNIRLRINEREGERSRTRELTLRELNLAPLDVIHLVDADLPSETSLAALARQRVIEEARSDGRILSSGADFTLDLARPSNWALDTIGLTELTELARTLRRLLAAARPADATTFAPFGKERTDGVIDVRELRMRANSALRLFRRDVKALGSRVRRIDDLTGGEEKRPVTATEATALRKALAPLWMRGHGLNPVMLDNTALLDHGIRVRDAAVATLETVARAMTDAAGASSASEGQIVGACLRVFAGIFGERFRVAPILKADATRRQIFARVDAARDDVAEWLSGMAAVRPAAGTLADLELYAAALDVGGISIAAGQLPADRTRAEPWYATTGPRDEAKSGAIAFVGCTNAALDWGRPVAALVVDEWSEVIPAATQTTGVAFHANAPGARAPHAILLAVHPAPGQPWDRSTLERTLRSTLDLCKLRAVDLECVTWVGRFLPALYIPTSELENVPHLPIREMVREFATETIREAMKR